METTFVLIKPDGVERGLVGRILTRFEEVGLEIQRMEMIEAEEEVARRHYPEDEDWLESVGGKTLRTYEEYEIDPNDELGTSDPIEIGRQVKEWLVDYITSGRVVICLIRGTSAVRVVRKLTGDTLPLFARPGTIRGDFETDSPLVANREQRPVRNLVHASGSENEAAREVELWFG